MSNTPIQASRFFHVSIRILPLRLYQGPTETVPRVLAHPYQSVVVLDAMRLAPSCLTSDHVAWRVLDLRRVIPSAELHRTSVRGCRSRNSIGRSRGAEGRILSG